MPKQRGAYVFDTSALFTFRDNEAGADEVEKILREAEHGDVIVSASFISFMEFYYINWMKEGEEQAKRTYLELKRLPLQYISESEDLGLLAGEIKATYRLSVADAWVAALAFYQDATLVHKDPEFGPLAKELPMLQLPYKKKQPKAGRK